jgi:hypothetical protein
VRSPQPKAINYKGSERRASGVPRGAAARSAPSAGTHQVTAAKLAPPRPVKSPATATGSDEGDWESF